MGLNHAQVFLIEGADGTGKTSYVERTAAIMMLNGQPEPRVIHNGPEDASLPGSLYRHYRAQLLDAIDFQAKGVSTFIDRSYLSEYVYGRVYRGSSRISHRQAKKLDRLAFKAGITQIAFEAQQPARKRRIESRGETFDGLQTFVAVMYHSYFRRPSSPWITVDSTSTIVTL